MSKWLIFLFIFGLVAVALYQKWRNLPPQTRQVIGLIFGAAKAQRAMKRGDHHRAQTAYGYETAQEQTSTPTSNTVGSRSNLMRPCARCGLHVPEHEGVMRQQQFYCCVEHAA